MPYVPKDDRPILDKSVVDLAEDLSSKLEDELNGDSELSQCYKTAFIEIACVLDGLEKEHDSTYAKNEKAKNLACEIFNVAAKYKYRGAWLGELNYSLTRLIQTVPEKMVEKKVWGEALRYWIYAQTVGALERAALHIDREFDDNWITDGLVGVLVDVKDEYKRRVNTAYEAVQIRKSGDCYEKTPYSTELVDVELKDAKTGEIHKGFQEVMKDRRKK